MAGRKSPPSTSVARSDGLVVRLAPETKAQQARRVVRRLVSKHLPGEWTARRLGSRTTRSLGFELLRRSPAIQPTMRQAFRWSARLSGDPRVAMAEPVPIQPGLEPPAAVGVSPPGGVMLRDRACSNDPEWAVYATRTTKAWKIDPRPGGKRFGQGVLVAHPDTGYTRHPEMADPTRILSERGYDFEDDRKDPRDPLAGRFAGHGTATASVIASAIGPQPDGSPEFVTGIAPRARIVPFRVSSSVVHLSFRKLARAIYAAVDARVHVISMSLGGPFRQEYLEEAIGEAVRQGILVLAAAGNYYPFVVFPAAFDNVVAVAATNCERKAWRFSASGPGVELSAPGESVWRARARRRQPYDVARGSGTSFAVAAVAGAAALWLSHHGRRRLVERYSRAGLAAAFRLVLTQSGVTRPRRWKSARHGAGILDVNKLLAARLPSKRAVARTTPSPARTATLAPDRPETRELQLLEHHFPGVSRQRLIRALRRLFEISETALPRLLERHGAELRFHVATNASFREFVSRGGRRATSPAGHRGLFGSVRASMTTALGDRIFEGSARR